MSKHRRWTLDQLLRKGVRRDIVLAKIETDADPHFYWNGIGLLDFDGATWVGLGELANVVIAPSTTQVQATDVTITLSGVDEDNLAMLDASIKGKKAWFWKAYLDEQYRVRFTVLLSECRLDQAAMQAQPNGSQAVQITGVGGFYFFENQETAYWDTEHQRDMLIALGEDPDSDTGFDLMSTLKNKQITWERPD